MKLKKKGDENTAGLEDLVQVSHKVRPVP